MNSYENSKGNVLFLILIAVALFAALSYAVTQSTRGGGNADDETLATEAAQIVQYAASVAVAVDRIMLMGGYAYTEIDSQGPGSDNTNCTVDDCRVFSTEKYGVSYIAPKEKWLVPDTGNPNWGEYRISYFPVNGVGSTGGTDQELVWILPALKEDLCIEINESLGVTSGGASPPTATSGINLTIWYTGGSVGGNLLTDAGGVLYAQSTGCFEISGGGEYVFYHVLDEK